MTRWLITAALAAGLAGISPLAAQTTAPELSRVRLAVGGKSGVFYLPLSVTERLGYFKDAGLDVEISDVQAGARTLQAVIGGSADIGTGTFDHAIQMQAKGQPVVAFIQYGRQPGFVLAMIAAKADRYRSPADLKGMKIGVTSPGSSSQFMVSYFMTRNGLKPEDASFIGTGTTSTAVAAARRGEIDAIVSSDPMVSVMANEKLIKIIADTRTPEGNQAVYGGPYPGGVLYATPAFIEKNPRTVQALTNAFARALRWIADHSAEDIAKLMPEEYALGNRPVYIQALTASKPTYSLDGRFVPEAARTAYDVLKAFDPAVAAAKIDLAKTYDTRFVDKVRR